MKINPINLLALICLGAAAMMPAAFTFHALIAV